MRSCAAVLSLALALTGCSALTGPPGGHRTPQEALAAVYPDAAVFQDATVSNDHIYLLKANKGTNWVLTMAELDKWGTWRVQGAMTVTGALLPLGPLTFMTFDLGHVESQVGKGTVSHAKEKAYGGEVLDPRITWVEIAIPSENVAAVRAPVSGTTWLVHFPWRQGLSATPSFTIRAGNGEGELFLDTDPWQTAKRLHPPTPRSDAAAVAIREARREVAYPVFVPTQVPPGVIPSVQLREQGVTKALVEIRYVTKDGGTELHALNGPAGCCLDGDPRKKGESVTIREKITAHYLDNQPQFGGSILWWQEAGSYIALAGPGMDKDRLVTIATGMSSTAEP